MRQFSTRAIKRVGAGITAGALLAGAGFTALPAMAAEGDVEVSGVNMSWKLNAESGGGAYFGGCNFLVAGKAGDAGSSRLWTKTDPFYKAEEGNVTITKPDAAGNQVQPTWDTKCKDANDKTVTTQATSSTLNQVNLKNGSGTINPATETGTISWDGSFTVVYYGGMTYWSASDLKLTVTNGTGALTATASGYGASMDDPAKWEKLPDQKIELATFKGADFTDTGALVATEYAGVEVNPDGGRSEQVRTNEGWGSFPASFVDYQVLTGQSSYWYTSGGAVDKRKVSEPLQVSYTLPATPGDNNDSTGGDIEVTLPEAETPETPETGEFSWKWESKDAVNLGTATQSGNTFVAEGTMNDVVVSDTRAGGDGKFGWTLSGSASDFAASSGDTFSAGYLGWTPKVVESSATVTPGAAVESTQLGGEGLANSHTLASSETAANATVNAGLKLVVPSTTKSGDFKSTVTITALS